MKEKIALLRLSLKPFGKLSTVLNLGFTHGVFNKMTEEAITKTLNDVIDRAEQAEKLEKENKELRAQLAQTNQTALFNNPTMRLNQIQAIGRIGQDAKIIVSNDRKFIAFSLAVDESYKDRNGNKVDKTVWYDCASEQERFLKIIEWLTKGREVFVTGKPSVRTYEKEGKIYGSIRINLDNLSLGSDGTNSQRAATTAQAPAQTRVSAPAAPAAAFNPAFNDDDESNDLPF